MGKKGYLEWFKKNTKPKCPCSKNIIAVNIKQIIILDQEVEMEKIVFQANKAWEDLCLLQFNWNISLCQILTNKEAIVLMKRQNSMYPSIGLPKTSKMAVIFSK